MVYRMAPSNQTRPEAEGFLHVTQVLLIISCAIIAPIFAIETWGFMQFVKGYFATSQARRGREFNRENIMLRVFLLLQNIIAFALVAQMAVPLYSIPWPSALNCDVFVILICIQYCTFTQITYFFFLTKAAIVNKVEKHKGAFVFWLNKLTFWGVAMFIPFFVVPYAAIRARGVISREGICTLYLQDVWFPAFFIAGNVGLCTALLYLFVRPLIMTAAWALKNNASTEEALRMKYVAKKNMVLATIMAICSTLSVIGTCVVTALVGNDMVQYDFVLIYSYSSTIIDVTVCNICARLMTNIWMPAQVKHRMCVHPMSSVDDQSDNTTGVKNVQGMSVHQSSVHSQFRSNPSSNTLNHDMNHSSQRYSGPVEVNPIVPLQE